jgi:hypothetical protein
MLKSGVGKALKQFPQFPISAFQLLIFATAMGHSYG